MTVKQLITALKKMPLEAEVFAPIDEEGNSYNPIVGLDLADPSKSVVILEVYTKGLDYRDLLTEPEQVQFDKEIAEYIEEMKEKNLNDTPKV